MLKNILTTNIWAVNKHSYEPRAHIYTATLRSGALIYDNHVTGLPGLKLANTE